LSDFVHKLVVINLILLGLLIDFAFRKIRIPGLTSMLCVKQKGKKIMNGIEIELPGKPPITLKHLVLDFTGTLSFVGKLLPGVDEALKELSEHLNITILTADTFGTAKKALENLPVEVLIVKNGQEKAKYVNSIGATKVVAIGNGRNDVKMMRLAALAICVMGPEGCASELISASDILVSGISSALDLLKNPLRIKATLRK
jgi:soluble P-type ATPase